MQKISVVRDSVCTVIYFVHVFYHVIENFVFLNVLYLIVPEGVWEMGHNLLSLGR